MQSKLAKVIVYGIAIVVVVAIVGVYALSVWGEPKRQKLQDEMNESIKKMEQMRGK